MSDKATKEKQSDAAPEGTLEKSDSEFVETFYKGDPRNDQFQTEAEAVLDPPDCDYYTYQQSDTNVFQVWKRFSDEGKISISWTEFQKLNEGTVLTQVKPGDKLCFPKGSLGQSEPESASTETATYDEYDFKEGDGNAFQVWQRFSKEGKTTISWEDFQILNQGVDFYSLSTGSKLRFPLGTLSGQQTVTSSNFTVAGDPNGTRVIRVAWTIDDGPQTNTESMHKTGLGGLVNTTWYVQRNRISETKYPELKKKQDAGGEIAVHSFHKSLDHAGWFPLKEPFSGAMDVWPSGTTQDMIMAELVTFNKELKDHGINPKFVRLPTGLSTELYDYGRTLGLSDTEAKSMRNKIIKGESVGDSEAGQTMLRDFNKIKDTLNSEELLLWGGASGAHTIDSQSWQAESSGSGGRTDDATKTVSQQRQDIDKNPGKFEKKVDEMIAANQTSTSLVVLAHDTFKTDVTAVQEDKKAMEAYALSKNVKIEYHTMSSLFKIVTATDPATLDVNYTKN